MNDKEAFDRLFLELDQIAAGYAEAGAKTTEPLERRLATRGEELTSVVQDVLYLLHKHLRTGSGIPVLDPIESGVPRGGVIDSQD